MFKTTKSILNVAEALDTEPIAMASHGRKGLEKLILGSVAAHAPSRTPLFVMIVRE